MKLRSFLFTHAGKGTVAGLGACILIAWPPALAWGTAVAGLIYAAGEFRESFRQLDAEAARKRRAGTVVTVTALAAAARDTLPAVVIEQVPVPAATPVGRNEAGAWQRQPA